MTCQTKRWLLALLWVCAIFVVSCSSAEPDISGPEQGVDGGLGSDVVSADDVEQVEECPEGAPCDDGLPCTENDVCNAEGVCEGGPVDCDDGLDCTADVCEEGACLHTLGVNRCISEGDPPVCLDLGAPDPHRPCYLCAGGTEDGSEWTVLADGAPCDDKDACTLGDLCEVGECVSKNPKVCPEGGPCTEAICEAESGCGFQLLEGPCEDGDACTVGDTCSTGECAPGGDALDCDDGDPCTTEVCEPASGCVTSPACDDDDPCTQDACEGDGTCVHTAIQGPCDDGDPCTLNEYCEQGICVGGQANPCEDDNTCTLDQCDSALPNGCQHFFLDDEPCNDSIACTGPDTCVSGLCIGEKDFCPYCPTPVTEHAVKATQFELSTDGYEGSGLDVDQDPTTCAPANNCAGGVDNALAPLASILNEPMADAVTNGDLMYVADLSAATPEILQNGLPFSMAILDCGLTTESADAGCDYQKDLCEYNTGQENYSGACQPWFYFDDAVYENGVITAGGIDHIITILMALSGGEDIPLTIGQARFHANAVLDVSGNQIVAMNGVVAGATPKQQLIDTVENIDPDLLALPTESIVNLLELLVDNDLDLDGDGDNDAASVGLRFKMIPASLK